MVFRKEIQERCVDVVQVLAVLAGVVETLGRDLGELARSIEALWCYRVGL
jgi:hypothetical protein